MPNAEQLGCKRDRSPWSWGLCYEDFTAFSLEHWPCYEHLSLFECCLDFEWLSVYFGRFLKLRTTTSRRIFLSECHFSVCVCRDSHYSLDCECLSVSSACGWMQEHQRPCFVSRQEKRRGTQGQQRGLVSHTRLAMNTSQGGDDKVGAQNTPMRNPRTAHVVCLIELAFIDKQNGHDFSLTFPHRFLFSICLPWALISH